MAVSVPFWQYQGSGTSPELEFAGKKKKEQVILNIQWNQFFFVQNFV